MRLRRKLEGEPMQSRRSFLAAAAAFLAAPFAGIKEPEEAAANLCGPEHHNATWTADSDFIGDSRVYNHARTAEQIKRDCEEIREGVLVDTKGLTSAVIGGKLLWYQGHAVTEEEGTVILQRNRTQAIAVSWSGDKYRIYQ